MFPFEMNLNFLKKENMSLSLMLVAYACNPS
jgi:hypothetical protein